MAGDLSAIGAANGYGQLMKASAPQKAEQTAEAGAPNKAAKAAEEFGAVFDKADATVAEAARGEASAQAVVEAMAEAEMALKTAVTLRDKVVEAYQEILRMPI